MTGPVVGLRCSGWAATGQILYVSLFRPSPSRRLTVWTVLVAAGLRFPTKQETNGLFKAAPATAIWSGRDRARPGGRRQGQCASADRHQGRRCSGPRRLRATPTRVRALLKDGADIEPSRARTARSVLEFRARTRERGGERGRARAPTRWTWLDRRAERKRRRMTRAGPRPALAAGALVPSYSLSGLRHPDSCPRRTAGPKEGAWSWWVAAQRAAPNRSNARVRQLALDRLRFPTAWSPSKGSSHSALGEYSLTRLRTRYRTRSRSSLLMIKAGAKPEIGVGAERVVAGDRPAGEKLPIQIAMLNPNVEGDPRAAGRRDEAQGRWTGAG